MAGIYVHIPFCKKKCIYCDFYSIAAKPGIIDEYVGAVCREAIVRGGALQGEAVRTVYIGGGTPSLLSVGQLSRMVDGLRSAFDLSAVEEFTIEVNPDDVSGEVVRAYVDLGINRVSMGVQSFIDSELRFLNRRHDAMRAVDAYESIISNGISNVSIDLIYGIPGQTLQSWRQSLDMAMRLRPSHISCYSLSYEEGTRLYRMLRSHLIQEVGDETCVKMYELMARVLEDNGYEHYEISNFALPGQYSRHNSSYWDKTPYLGLGASAHSYAGGVRYYNPDSIKSYIDGIACGKAVAVGEELSLCERYDEEVMLRLRTSKGIDAGALRGAYGIPFYDYFMSVVKRFVDSGLMECDGSRYRLSRKGVMLSDMIMRELMYV